MKMLTFLFVLSFFIQTAVLSQCLPDGITFSTQAQIDNFQVNYPNCTIVEGDVNIQGGWNLEALNVLTAIGGSLGISSSYYGALWGLDNITEVGGDLGIGQTHLTWLVGLGSLSSIGGKLRIVYNDNLVSLEGLNSLAEVGGDLEIIDNENLLTLVDMEGITTIGGNLEISKNDVLNSLEGLENIDAASIGNLSVYYNNSLHNCNVQSICDYLLSPNGTIDIYQNAAGCQNPTEIANNCDVTLSCLPFGNYTFMKQSDIDSFQTDYSDCSQLNGNVTISGDYITNLLGLRDVTSIGSTLAFINTDLLQNVDGLNNLDSIGGQLQFYQTGVTNINGLESLSYVGLRIYLYRNSSLTSLSGLENLTSAPSLYFRWNTKLTDLAGLDNVTIIKGNLELDVESKLTSFQGLQNLDSIEGSFMLWGNENMVDFSGLNNLTYIGNKYHVRHTYSLNSFAGLDNLNYIGGDVLLYQNNNFVNLNGLEKVDYIGGNLSIKENLKLTSLTGLGNVKSIKGHLIIRANESLPSLSGLDSIDAASISLLNISSNNNLSTCEVQSVCDYLAAPGGTIAINNNDAGCDSQEEVEKACKADGLGEIKVLPSTFISPNPFTTSTTITYELPHPTTVQISIFNQLGALVDVIQETQSPGKQQVIWNANRQPSGMYYFTIQIGDEIARGKMVKLGN